MIGGFGIIWGPQTKAIYIYILYIYIIYIYIIYIYRYIHWYISSIYCQLGDYILPTVDG